MIFQESENLPIPFGSVVRLAEHFAVGTVGCAALAPSGYVVGVHFGDFPDFVLVCVFRHSAVWAVGFSCRLSLGCLRRIDTFACNLVFGTENVRIVLHKSADAHQPVHRSRRLVAVALAELGESHRKVAPTPQLGIENQDVARAVHRLHGHFHVAGERLEHILVILVRMAGLYPQNLVHDLNASIPALRLGNAHASVVTALALYRCPE